MKRFLILLVLALAPAARAEGVVGTWLSPDGLAKARIAPCGPQMCGMIVWLKIPNDPSTGKPPADTLNPDPALRGRPILGLRFLSGFQPASGGRWTGGKIYDPKSGKTYDSRLGPGPGGALKLEGCVGPFCKTQIWTPAS
jgi:uncharacterized protein (DUF2147 family)